RYAVISLVSEAGSTRSSALAEASTWLLVASTSTHERAFTPGGGTCANAVPATSAAGSARPSANLLAADCGTKEARRARLTEPEFEKRIGWIRAEMCWARKRVRSSEDSRDAGLTVAAARKRRRFDCSSDCLPRGRFAQRASHLAPNSPP